MIFLLLVDDNTCIKPILSRDYEDGTVAGIWQYHRSETRHFKPRQNERGVQKTRAVGILFVLTTAKLPALNNRTMAPAHRRALRLR